MGCGLLAVWSFIALAGVFSVDAVPVCMPRRLEGTMVQDDIVVKSWVATRSHAVITAAPVTATGAELWRVEWALGFAEPLIPFHVVARLLTPPLGAETVDFVSVEGELFRVHVYNENPAQPLSRPATVVGQVLSAKGNVVFIDVVDASLWVFVAGDDEASRRVAANALSFVLGSDGCMAVYSDGASLVRLPLNASGVAEVLVSNVNSTVFRLSQDSEWLAYIVDGTKALYVVQHASSAPPRLLTAAGSVSKAPWWCPRSLLLCQNESGILLALSDASSGGSLTPLMATPVELVGEPVCFEQGQVVFASTTGLWKAVIEKGGGMGLVQLSTEPIESFLVIPVSSTVVFATVSGSLYKASLLTGGGGSSVLLRGGTAVRNVAPAGLGAFTFVDGNLWVGGVNNDDAPVQVSIGNVERAINQPNGVSSLFLQSDGAIPFVGCLVPPVVLAHDERLDADVRGHLFVEGGNSSIIGAGISIQGTAVLGGCTLDVVYCNVSQGLGFTASWIVGSVGVVNSSACPPCTLYEGSVTLSETSQLLQWELVLDATLCESHFSWAVFGIVVGTCTTAVIVTIGVIVYRTRRELKAVNERLQMRAAKYKELEAL